MLENLGDKTVAADSRENTQKSLSNELLSHPHDFLAALKEITAANTDDKHENPAANKKQSKKDELGSLEIITHDPAAAHAADDAAKGNAAHVESLASAQTMQKAAAEQLTAQAIARAWQDPEYRQSLSELQIAGLPANPAGDIQFASRAGNTTNFVKLAYASTDNCSSSNCSSSNCSSDNCSSSNCSSSNCSSNNCSSANCGMQG